MTEMIQTQHVTFAYEPQEGCVAVPVLRGVSLTVQEGTFVAILGHNGSGKSTLAKHFNAILVPDSGTVTVSGMNTAEEEFLLKIRGTVGMVFQNPDNQIVSNVVEEDVAFAPENMGVAPEEIRRRVDEALAVVGMEQYKEHAPHLLSGGQKQRVAIAGVLAMNPRCIVFDESTAMLDPRGRADVVEIIGRLRREFGTTVILITHNMDETIGADRLIVMSDGQIVMDGTPGEVFSRVEELRSYGLDVPETTDILYRLNGKGHRLPLDALSVEDCAAAIFAEFAPKQ